MSKHIGWIVPVLLTLVGGLLWLNMAIVSIKKDIAFLDKRIELVITHCCDLDKRTALEYVTGKKIKEMPSCQSANP
jgi:hypothetical protein